MKNITLKALVALAGMAVTANAFAVTVYLNQTGQRAGSGAYYDHFVYGEDGGTASTATWDWDAGTGTLTMTSGMLYQTQRIMNTTNPNNPTKQIIGASILSDSATGLTITTGGGVGPNLGADATTYNCIEGTFNAGTFSSACKNTSFGFDSLDDSSVAYNVNGQGECTERTVGNDDAAGAGNIYRGLRDWNGTGSATCGGATVDGDNTGRGALDWMQVIVDTTGGLGMYNLILADWNNAGTVSMNCINPGASNAACGRAHWAIFSTQAPIPAAVWLFGSALGLLGWVRRRAMA
jgi:hypothetical protein